jgi:hypothetical protein
MAFLTTCSGSAKNGQIYLMLDMIRMRTKIQNSYFGYMSCMVSLTTCSGSTKKGESYLRLAMVRITTKSSISYFLNTRLVFLSMWSVIANKAER